MRPKKLLFLCLMALGVALLAGCGGSSPVVHSVAGSFSNASLNGNYAFTLSGVNAGGPFAVAGRLQASRGGSVTPGGQHNNSAGTRGDPIHTPGTRTQARHAGARGPA